MIVKQKMDSNYLRSLAHADFNLILGWSSVSALIEFLHFRCNFLLAHSRLNGDVIFVRLLVRWSKIIKLKCVKMRIKVQRLCEVCVWKGGLLGPNPHVRKDNPLFSRGLATL